MGVFTEWGNTVLSMVDVVSSLWEVKLTAIQLVQKDKIKLEPLSRASP